MKLLILLLLTNIACHTTNNIVKTQILESGEEVNVKRMIIDKKMKQNDTSQNFKIKSFKQKDKTFQIDLQYSGGCNVEHQFELISTGKIDADGIMDMRLIDLTVGDNCKMMVMKTKVFDIAQVSKKKAVNGFRINGLSVK